MTRHATLLASLDAHYFNSDLPGDIRRKIRALLSTPGFKVLASLPSISITYRFADNLLA
jgi:hypothetical protein